MRSFHLNLIFLLFFFWSCDRWDYPDESNPVSQSFPVTYLSLVAVDTIYASIDSVTGGGTATRTVQIAKSIQNDFGVESIILSTDQGLDKTSKAVSFWDIGLIILFNEIGGLLILF